MTTNFFTGGNKSGYMNLIIPITCHALLHVNIIDSYIQGVQNKFYLAFL